MRALRPLPALDIVKKVWRFTYCCRLIYMKYKNYFLLESAAITPYL